MKTAAEEKGIINKLAKTVIFLMLACSIGMALLGCSSDATSPKSSQNAPESSSEATEQASEQTKEYVDPESVAPEGPIEPKNTVNDYTLKELSIIANEISTSPDKDAAMEVAKKYQLCDPSGNLTGNETKTLADKSDEFTIQIVGFYHDDLVEGGKAGITFITKDSIASLPPRYSLPWPESLTKKKLDENANAPYHENNEWNSLGRKVRDYVKPVIKDDSSSANIGCEISQTEDTFWIPSLKELCGEIGSIGYSDIKKWDTCKKMLNKEGQQYQLFKEQNVHASSAKDAKVYSSIEGIAKGKPCILRSCYGVGITKYGGTEDLGAGIFSGKVTGMFDLNDSDDFALVVGFCF